MMESLNILLDCTEGIIAKHTLLISDIYFNGDILKKRTFFANASASKLIQRKLKPDFNDDLRTYTTNDSTPKSSMRAY
ncbi:MAG: hypothetical protein GDA42_01275 [Ekhidna sp.]|nr:hypothetical protein [Ekhidna sp.]